MNCQESIGIRIRTIDSMLKRSIDNSNGTKMIQNMTGTNAWVIAYIAGRSELGLNVFQKDLEGAFGVTRSSVSKVITLMEKKGLIARKSVNNDGRLKKLVLTEKANELAAYLKADVMQVEARLAKGFSQDELHQLFSYLGRIEQNLQCGPIKSESTQTVATTQEQE